MPSRSVWIKGFSLLALCVTLVQCSYFFEEKKKETEVAFEQEVGSCIGRVNRNLGQYFSRDSEIEINADHLDEFSNCYQESLESFVTYTKSGRLESDDYSAENIELLVQRFHPEVNLTAERIRGYIRLKSFLIGGGEDTISKEELRTLQRFLPLLAEGLKELLPHRKTWLRIEQPPRDADGYAEFDTAFSKLKEELGALLSELDGHRGNRRVNVHEVSEFLFKELFDDDFQSYLKYQTLIAKFKNFVVFEDDDTLKRGNLTLFARQAALTYEAITRFDYFLKEDDADAVFTNLGHVVSFVTKVPSQLERSSLFKGVGLRALNDTYASAEAILTYSIRSRPEQKIPMDRLRDVLLSLEEAEIMNGTLTASTLSYFIRGFSRKWLNPGGPDDPDFSMAKVHYIKNVFDKWVRRQQIANTLFANAGEDTVSLVSLESQLPDQPELREWYELFRDGADDREISTHQWDSHNRVLYSRDINHFSYEELTVSNSISMLVEIFMKPFNVNEPDPLRYKVTDNQAQDIYEVMRVLGVEMAFMDSRVDDSGHRAFRETNNFSTQKSSDAYLDFYEGFEYLAVAMNAGELADWIYDEFPKTDRCMTNIQDVHRRDIIDANCFRAYLRNNFLKYFGHLTSIAEYWRGANDLEKTVFLRSLEVASRAGVIREKPYDLSEIRVTVSILSYLQSIYYMFDREHRNGFIDGIEASPGASELRRAELHFRPLIVDFLQNKKPELLEEHAGMINRFCGAESTAQQKMECMAPKIFIQLLRRGDLPLESSDVCGGIGFFTSMFEINENVRFRETRSSPGDVLKVFSALAKITLDSHKNRVKDFIVNRRQELIDSLEPIEAPDCREDPSQVFCRWGREIYCNETIFPDVYNFFRNNRRRLFMLPNYSEDAEGVARQTMVEIYEEFSDGPRSTLCAFPPIFPDEERSFVGGVWEDCVAGDDDDAGVIERGGQLMRDVREGIRDIWDSL